MFRTKNTLIQYNMNDKIMLIALAKGDSDSICRTFFIGLLDNREALLHVCQLIGLAIEYPNTIKMSSADSLGENIASNALRAKEYLKSKAADNEDLKKGLQYVIQECKKPIDKSSLQLFQANIDDLYVELACAVTTATDILESGNKPVNRP